jgi:hypothetical protein
VRYFVVLGILPALHWCFELADVDRPSRVSASRCIFLGIQVAVLGLTILVRSSAAYLLVPVIVTAIHSWRRERVIPARHQALFRFVLPSAMLVAILGVLPPLAFPEYAKTGLTFGVFWHRAFISFGAHPAWPFAGLRERYPCAPEIPEGLVPSIVDRNGACVWWLYRDNRARPVVDVVEELYGRDYESALRSAYLGIIRSYPWQALQTYLYFKPKMMLEEIRGMLDSKWSTLSSIGLLAILQFMVLVAFIGGRPAEAPIRDAACRAGVLFLFLVPALAPQFVAWSVPYTAADLFTFLLCGCVICFWLFLSCAFRFIAASRM